MTHWFDTLSKTAARSDGMGRRSFLAFGTVLGFGALGGGAQAEVAAPRAGAVGGAAARAGIRATPGVAPSGLGSHTRRTAGDLVIHELSTQKGGVSVQSTLAVHRSSQNATLSTTISQGSVLVAKIDAAMAKSGAGTASINYGPAVSGVRNVTVSTKNGKSFQGTMDGRAFTAAGKTQSLRDIQFADGAAAPHVAVDQRLASAVADVGTQANALMRSQPSAQVGQGPRPPGPPPQPHGNGGPKFHRPKITGPGFDWYEPGDDFVDCTYCESTTCANIYFDLLPGWATILFCPPCAVVDTAAALAAYAGCMIYCHLPGGGCLPNPCGSFTTCAKGDTCYDFDDGRLCCPSPSAVCKNVCCGTDIPKCGSDGTCGCPTDTKTCGSNCCTENQVCTDGVCCDPGIVACKGVCCGKGQTCHNGSCCNQNNICGPTCCDELSSCLDPKTGKCCGFDQQMCGNTCCPIGSHCINGKCCGADSICGTICCPPGQTCSNAAKHTCTTCPPKTVPCLSSNGKGLCCPAGVDCCGSTCCNPGEVCQAGAGGTIVCGPQEIPK